MCRLFGRWVVGSPKSKKVKRIKTKYILKEFFSTFLPIAGGRAGLEALRADELMLPFTSFSTKESDLSTLTEKLSKVHLSVAVWVNWTKAVSARKNP